MMSHNNDKAKSLETPGSLPGTWQSKNVENTNKKNSSTDSKISSNKPEIRIYKEIEFLTYGTFTRIRSIRDEESNRTTNIQGHFVVRFCELRYLWMTADWSILVIKLHNVFYWSQSWASRLVVGPLVDRTQVNTSCNSILKYHVLDGSKTVKHTLNK